MKKDNFLWLQTWYFNHCDGDWEHSWRIHLESMDNPGWLLTVNVKETELENKEFQKMKINRTQNDWVFCAIEDNKFEGACGPSNLPEVFKVFREWAEKHQKTT